MESVLIRMSSLFSDEGWLPEGAIELDLRHLQGTTCYCEKAAEAVIEESFKDLPVNALHWIDGGDFHYLSEIWMRSLDKAFQLILIDNHPDDQKPSFDDDLLSCGGWVAHARKNNCMMRPCADQVYLSIDLDWLSPDFARTNWDQGDGTIDGLMQLVREKTEGKTIAGVDICGGITSAQGGSAHDFTINRKTRDALLGFFRAI